MKNIPNYVLDKANATKTGISKILIDSKTLNALMNIDYHIEKADRLKLVIDFIDLPIKIVSFPEKAPGDITLKLFFRQCWESDDMKEDGIITWSPSSGSLYSAVADNDKVEEFKDIAVCAYYFVNIFLAETDEYNHYDTTDLDLENLLLYTEDGEVKADIVYGTDRPDLTAKGLFDENEYEYVRPCANEENKILAAKKNK